MIERVHNTATDEVLEWSSLHSLGLLEGEEARAFEKHLESGCAVCSNEVRRFREVAAHMAAMAPAAEPSPSVRDRLMARIGRKEAARVVRPDAMEWKPSAMPGIFVKVLFSDKVTGATTSLVRMEAGAHYPPHRHAGLEQLYILEGDLVFEDHTLTAGDYEISESSSDHAPATTRNGCMVLVMNHRNDQILAHA